VKKDVIFCKDSTSMSEVPDNRVDLIVSGPPYWEYIDYKAFTAQKVDYEWTEDPSSASYPQFLEKLKAWYTECFRVLRPGRYCIVNLGTVRKKGVTYPLPFHAVSILEKIGFSFKYEIIWHRLSGGRQHARVVIQNPYPGYFTPNNRTEYLLVFQKDPKKPFTRNLRKQKSPLNCIKLDDEFKKEIANNVWHIMPACHSSAGLHPCPFPPEIPLRLIKLFSLRGEVVLDPFMGIGTTARAARELGRHYIGYEILPEFIKQSRDLLNLPLKVRRRD